MDVEDFDRVMQYKWCTDVHSHTVYAIRGWREGGKSRSTRLHNFIMQAAGIDHVDGNGLNNCRENLRAVTPQQNVWNRRMGGSASGLVGVVRVNGAKWKAQIIRRLASGRRTCISLGYFTDRDTAGRAYDEAACDIYGKFAACNFGPPGYI